MSDVSVWYCLGSLCSLLCFVDTRCGSAALLYDFHVGVILIETRVLPVVAVVALVDVVEMVCHLNSGHVVSG